MVRGWVSCAVWLDTQHLGRTGMDSCEQGALTVGCETRRRLLEEIVGERPGLGLGLDAVLVTWRRVELHYVPVQVLCNIASRRGQARLLV